MAQVFDGDSDLERWIGRIGLEQLEVVDIIQHCLSDAVRACVLQVQLVIVGEREALWPWTWRRLKKALREIKSQISKYKGKCILKGVAIAGGSLAMAFLAPPLFLGILEVVGFTSAGVAAGSIAAGIHSSIGLVEAGSLFAFCQSAAAGGYALAALEVGCVAAGAATGAIASAAASAKEIMEKPPSTSWEDGHNFVPSRELIKELADYE